MVGLSTASAWMGARMLNFVYDPSNSIFGTSVGLEVDTITISCSRKYDMCLIIVINLLGDPENAYEYVSFEVIHVT